MKKMAALAAIAAALVMAPRNASAQTIVTCESRDGQRELCRADTSGGVTLHRQLSSTSCIQGRTWNLGRGVIWVSNGCRAQFLVASNGGRYNNGGYNNNGYNNNGGYDNNRNASSTENLCRRAVRQQLGRRVEVNTWAINNSRNNARVGWRLSNGRSGQCRIDRNGNVSVLVNRGR